MILIDPRTGSVHMRPLIEALGVPVDVTPLEFGDIAFLGNGPDGPVKVGIEIKGGNGGSDFLQSMQSDRLVGVQIPGLVEHYDRRYLIVEGLRATKNGLIWTAPRRRVFGQSRRPLFLADVKKYLAGVEESGTRIRHTREPEETARVIVKELYVFWQKDYDAHTSISANVLYSPPLFSLRTEDPTTARIRRVLVALKAGVGVGRSKAVAAHFGSVLAVATSDVRDWQGIEGVGTKVAGDVIQALRESTQNARTEKARTARVSPRHGAAHRSTRRTRNRQDKQLDTGRRAQRRVPQARTRRRVADRHRTK